MAAHRRCRPRLRDAAAAGEGRRPDPLADIGNTQAIWRVIKDGRLYDPAELQAAGRYGRSAR